ncbi:MAG: DUF4412 domain-containing protein [Bacteroidales bacterium]|nr:DUF4412 domain-containing protein [Bacteroidales bacterium]MCF8389098.1 DUF4412 domain-containing protein [Bacteroidales bacterium]
MKKFLSLLSIIILSSVLFQIQAQAGNYLMNKAKQASQRAGQKSDEKVTKEMNKEVDKGVEKVFNNLFGDEKKEANPGTENSDSNADSVNSTNNQSSTPPKGSGSSSDDARANAMLKAMGINMAPVNVNETYDYSGNILMNVQSWDDKGKTEGIVEYKSFITKDNSGFAMEFKEENKEKAVMIFDYKNEKMIILSDDGETKSGMVTEYAGMAEKMTEAVENADENSETDEVTDYSEYREGMKKTGKSKTIAGYKCDEYIYEDEETNVQMWMTDQLPADLWANMFSANVMSGNAMGFYGGFVMEMDQQDKNSQDRVYMLVKEVNENQSATLSTKGYQLISIGGMPQE